MRGVATIAVMGGALVAAPVVLNLPVAASAAVSIAVGVGVSTLACEGLGALTIAAGALGALSMNLLSDDGVMAGAAFVALALAPRSMRGRTARWRVAHGAVSAIAGGLAAWVAWRYGGEGSAAVRAAALVVAGLIASVTLLMPADDTVAWTLSAMARATPGSTGEHLLRAVSLRRRVEGSPSVEALAEATASRLELAWRALTDIASQRVSMASLQGASVGVLDRRIEQHVEALERIHAAADERFARAAGLTDQRLAEARIDGETLETEVRALVEVMPN
ncbi:MAG: hypothetical protein U0326_07145 [Polyangiales bacterium]